MFDFSGTLFKYQCEPGWLDELTATMSVADAHQIAAVTGHIGSLDQRAGMLPSEMFAAWEKRDLDPWRHRLAYLALLRAVGADRPGVAEILYGQMINPSCWQPYPDTLRALRLLARAHLRVAIVSNISLDIRAVLRRYRASRLVSEVVMSYVEGVTKPDPRIFRIACQRIGARPERTLMIGDDEATDGGAAVLGIRVVLVQRLSMVDGSHAVLDALTECGLIDSSH